MRVKHCAVCKRKKLWNFICQKETKNEVKNQKSLYILYTIFTFFLTKEEKNQPVKILNKPWDYRNNVKSEVEEILCDSSAYLPPLPLDDLLLT